MDIDNLYLILVGLALIAVGAYLYACYRLYKSKKIIGPMIFLFLGMAISALCGFLAFFGTDSTKGWNPLRVVVPRDVPGFRLRVHRGSTDIRFNTEEEETG